MAHEATMVNLLKSIDKRLEQQNALLAQLAQQKRA